MPHPMHGIAGEPHHMAIRTQKALVFSHCNSGRLLLPLALGVLADNVSPPSFFVGSHRFVSHRPRAVTIALHIFVLPGSLAPSGKFKKLVQGQPARAKSSGDVTPVPFPLKAPITGESGWFSPTAAQVEHASLPRHSKSVSGGELAHRCDEEEKCLLCRHFL